MLRPLVLLFAVAIAAVPAPPAAAQQPRRTPPARRRPPPVTAPRIPTPRSVLGFEPGDDRKLADWPTLVRYYQALASASDRMRYRELGHSTLGAPMIALVISSPQNLRALDRYRELNAQLADPRGFKTGKEAEDVLRGGKTIVLITSGIHSTEVGGHLSPAVLAYRLASDPRQCDPLARAVAQPRRGLDRHPLVQPDARHHSRGHRSTRAVSPLRGARQQPRLVRVHPSGDAAGSGLDPQRLAPADRARHSPAGHRWVAALPAALPGSDRAERRSPAGRRRERPRHRHGMGARRAGKDGDRDQCGVRRMDARPRV